MAGTESDEELVAFLHSVQLRLSRLALVLTGDRDKAEDLVQDTLVKVVRKWPEVAGSSNRVAYACAVMLNQWRDGGRRRARALERERLLAARHVEHDAEHLDDRVLDRISMDDALARLTAKQRAVLYFRYYEDLSVSEVAERLGCSQGTVKSQTSYALSVLSRSGALAPESS